MSVRAYKIIEIKTEKQETFNCWHDERIWELLGNFGCWETLNDDGCGIICVSRSDIEEYINDPDEQKDRQLDADDIEILKKMLKDCGKNEWVQYYCY